MSAPSSKVGKWIVAAAVVGIAAIVFLPTRPTPAERLARETGTPCVENLGQIGKGLLLYAADNDQRLPAGDWMGALAKYANETAFHCPAVSATDKDAYGYAFNAELWNQHLTTVRSPEKRAVVYDSSAVAKSVSDPGTSLPILARHLSDGKKRNNILTLDGHVDKVEEGLTPPWFSPAIERPQPEKWRPK